MDVTVVLVTDVVVVLVIVVVVVLVTVVVVVLVTDVVVVLVIVVVVVVGTTWMMSDVKLLAVGLDASSAAFNSALMYHRFEQRC